MSLGHAARATSQCAETAAHTAHTIGENAMIDQMTVARAQDVSIRPFRIELPEEQLADLRRRIAAMRWPSAELVADRSQGVQLATLQALARYWTTEYDWRTCEARLNALPQFPDCLALCDADWLPW
jgi:hypothetical protein